jgi:cbb3-type cytochrome oxidase subunit 3
MLLAYDYPLLSIFLSVMWFFLWVIWLMTLFHVIADVFRSKDLHGVSKAVWLLFVLFLPFLGVLTYVFVRGDKMAEHAAEVIEARDAAAQDYIRQAAGSSGVAAELAHLKELRGDGTLSDEEYEAAKRKVLA